MTKKNQLLGVKGTKLGLSKQKIPVLKVDYTVHIMSKGKHRRMKA